MALVYCTDIEPVKVLVFGKWFEFKAGQIKDMQDSIKEFLVSNRKQNGFVDLPDSYQDDPQSEESIKIKSEKTDEGRRNIVKHLNFLRHNFEVSTQKDIDISGEKRSYMTELQDEHKEMYRRLALFRKHNQDKFAQDLEEIQKLKELIDGGSNTANAKAANTGSPDIPQPARSK